MAEQNANGWVIRFDGRTGRTWWSRLGWTSELRFATRYDTVGEAVDAVREVRAGARVERYSSQISRNTYGNTSRGAQ